MVFGRAAGTAKAVLMAAGTAREVLAGYCGLAAAVGGCWYCTMGTAGGCWHYTMGTAGTADWLLVLNGYL